MLKSRAEQPFTMPLTEYGALTLRPIEQSDDQALFQLVDRDRDYLRVWQNWPDVLQSYQDMRLYVQTSLFKSRNRQGFDMLIEYHGHIVGKIGIVYINWTQQFGEIGYWLAQNAQGRGLITRAVWLITGYSICTLGIPNIYIRCATGNVKSRAIPERLGFQNEGIQPRQVIIHGQAHDDMLYTLSKKDWYKNMIYHITTQQAWEAAQAKGTYRAPSLEAEGFIHASTRDQILWVANKFYVGAEGLVILAIDRAKLNAELREEPANSNMPLDQDDLGLFPHIYGELNTDAVLKVFDFPSQADGSFQLPDDLKA
jgi:ribosomal-protein-serine acetyltransferase